MIDLDAIEARAKRVYADPHRPTSPDTFNLTQNDVPALVAEVKRLRKLIVTLLMGGLLAWLLIGSGVQPEPFVPMELPTLSEVGL